ncbi:plasma kallikrein-like [Tropilaelaps mercedesae]|uniref:Plasma kallikrein-like n=1 Tax=Tropilaelaps mercedesae TaxID=418985 RepID=A0A1V9XDD3_9ACAR|nr:plasma kallikrein-like [Tropilaelaps mercedesae]
MSITLVLAIALDAVIAHEECGLGHTRSSYILLGENVLSEEFPWQISLQKYRWSPNRGIFFYHVCGGSVIAPNWVLSAAHCVSTPENKPDPNDWFILPGLTNITNQNPWLRYVVESIIVQPSYTLMKNDVALLRTYAKFHHGVAVPLCIRSFTDSELFSSVVSNCITTGWGINEPLTLTLNPILRLARLRIINKRACISRYDDQRIKYLVTDSTVCAEGEAKLCSGDSGGPLACLYHGRYFLIGVASWGSNCFYQRDRNIPQIFMRVSAYLGWINESITMKH